MDVGGQREHALVDARDQRHGLLGGSVGALEVAGHRRRPALGDQRPGGQLPVAGEPPRLDGALGGVQRLRQTSANLERVREPDHHRRDELSLAGRARDRDAAPQMPDRRVVVLAEVLGEAEVVRRLQPCRQAPVVERVDRGRGPFARVLRGGNVSFGVAGVTQQCRRHRAEARVSESGSGRRGLCGVRAHRREVRVVQGVGGQLHTQGDGRGAVIGRQL